MSPADTPNAQRAAWFTAGNGPDFPDNDGDGFAASVAGGLDCNDDNPFNLSNLEDLTNGIDDDRDTWIDDVAVMDKTISITTFSRLGFTEQTSLILCASDWGGYLSALQLERAVITGFWGLSIRK